MTELEKTFAIVGAVLLYALLSVFVGEEQP